MSEGGLLQWKRQRHDQHRGPACDYGALKKPLPDPPNGTTWVYNTQTKEWCVTQIQVDVAGSSAVVAVTGDDDDDDEGCATNGRKIEEAVIVSSECIDGGKIVDDGYISHRVCSTDTFQGLCLKYKVAPTTLRQLNRFSGSNLSSAPTTLIIPKGTFTKGTLSPSKSAGQDPEEQNIHRFLHALKIFLIGLGPTGRKTTVGRKEAIAYLHMHDGNLEDAIQEAKDDIEWEGNR